MHGQPRRGHTCEETSLSPPQQPLTVNSSHIGAGPTCMSSLHMFLPDMWFVCVPNSVDSISILLFFSSAIKFLFWYSSYLGFGLDLYSFRIFFKCLKLMVTSLFLCILPKVVSVYFLCYHFTYYIWIIRLFQVNFLGDITLNSRIMFLYMNIQFSYLFWILGFFVK